MKTAMKSGKYISFILCLGAALFIASCTTTRYIILKQDGSAYVKGSVDVDSINEAGRFYKSSQITNLSINYEQYGVSFNITTIDSLGRYLSPMINRNMFQFKYYHDSLTVMQAEESLFKRPEVRVNILLEITPEQKIKNILTNNKHIKQKKNSVIISSVLHSSKKTGKNLKLTIVFDK